MVNGSGQVGQATDVAAYLEYLGLTASAPTKRPDHTVQQTTIKVYNGHETELPATIALLENVFNVKATYVTDPSVLVDIIVTTGTQHAQPDRPAGALTRPVATVPQAFSVTRYSRYLPAISRVCASSAGRLLKTRPTIGSASHWM